jgi:hypothetical protein
MEKDCPNDPAMAATFDTDFRKGAESVKGWKQTAGSLAYNQEGAQFTINKKGDSPTIQSETYLHFGYVEVKCKAAAGQGIISSIVLQSEDLDEIDWEFIGTVPNTVQMNYFGKGNTTTYDRMIEAPVSNVQNEMHTYALDWTAERLVYIIDGTPVRTLKFGDANGGKNYPQTPSTVRIGIWAGGDPDNEAGVIEWAGGKTDYSKAPFTMTVESIKVKNYSPGKEYKWTDKSGSWESIEVIGKGDTNGAPENSVGIQPSATATGGGLNNDIDVPTATGAPAESGAPAQSAASSSCSTAVVNGTSSTCSCDVATVTMTGPSPPATTLATTPVPSGGAPPASYPGSAPPPYPTGGLEIDTKPAPSGAYPTGGVYPPGNTTTPPPSQFTGAATNNRVGAFALLAGAAAMLVF